MINQSWTTQQMQNFVDTVKWCGLRDLGFFGPRFTWLYQQRDGFQIEERLDRGFATVDWLDRFPSAKIFHRTSSVSDLCPLVLQLKERKKVKHYSKTFHFEAMWLKDSSCEEIVNSAGEEASTTGLDFLMVKSLDNCCIKLEI